MPRKKENYTATLLFKKGRLLKDFKKQFRTSVFERKGLFSNLIIHDQIECLLTFLSIVRFILLNCWPSLDNWAYLNTCWVWTLIFHLQESEKWKWSRESYTVFTYLSTCHSSHSSLKPIHRINMNTIKLWFIPRTSIWPPRVDWHWELPPFIVFGYSLTIFFLFSFTDI